MRRMLMLVLAGGCVIASLGASAARAWPPGAVPLCAASGEQIDLVALSDGAGGVYAAWSDQRSGDYDVYVQHLDASGEPAAGYPFDGQLVGGGAGTQRAPLLALDSDGQCWLVWKDTFAAILRRAKLPPTLPPAYVPTSVVMTRPVPATASVAICAVSPDQLFLFFAPGGSGSGVLMVKSIGGPNDPTTMALGSGDASSCGSVCAIPDGAGGAFVAWQRTKNSVIDLAIQRVSPGPIVASGWPQNGAVLCSAVGSQESPAIVPDGDGGLFATWADRRSGNSDIYLARLSPSGATPSDWPLNGIAVSTATGTQALPQLTRVGSGGVLLAWEDSRTASTDIYAAGWSSTGVRDPGWPVNGGPVSAATSIQLTPVLAPSTDGSAYLAWATLQGGVSFDVAVARASSHGGSTPAPNGQLVSTAINDQVAPVIVPGPANDAIVLWQDFRDGAADLYAQHISLGTPLDAPGPGMSSAALRVWPQPARGGVARVDFVLADDQPATLTLLDVAGRVVGEGQVVRGAGAHVRMLGSAALAPGLYLARLEHAGGTQSARMLVVR